MSATISTSHSAKFLSNFLPIFCNKIFIIAKNLAILEKKNTLNTWKNTKGIILGLLNIKQIKIIKRLIKVGYKKVKNATNPIVSSECVGTKINKLGEEVSIFRQKRRFGRPKLSEKITNDTGVELTEQQLKDERFMVWEDFYGNQLVGNVEFTPKILQQIEALVTQGVLKKEYAEIFKSNINKEGVNFIESCYNDLAKSMGYKKYPDLAFVDFWSSSAFNPKTIKISLSAFPEKSLQIKVLRHELEHFRQEELVYRVFGEEKYINAKIEPFLQKLKINEDFCKSKFGKPYSELTKNEICQLKSDLYAKIKESCNVFKDSRVNNMETTAQEIKEAQIYLKAIENYKSPNMVLGNIELDQIESLRTTNPKLYKLAQEYCIEYNLNALEKGATNKENEIEKMFEAFIELF